MSYAAVEVDLLNGRVLPRGGELLPDSARALLVVLESPTPAASNSANISQTLNAIRQRQSARGHVPPSAAAVDQQIRAERDSWE